MDPQPRASFEAPVRQFEDRVLGLAISLAPDRGRAENIVEQAFARVLTGRNDKADLEARLSAMTHKLARSRVSGPVPPVLPSSDVRASRDLHLRILDAIEDRQYTSQPVRSRLIALGAALLVVAVAGVVQLQRTRAEALAAAAPTIADLTPAPGAAEVAVDGQFRVQFARRPIGTPTLKHLPADGSQHLAGWDGTTLLIDYTGLRFGVLYQVTLDASYQSKLRETGHFVRQWTFVSEGPARLVATTPSDGTAMVPRNGQLAIELSRRPQLEPTISILPADAGLPPGRWGSSAWLVDYSGLRPLQRYQVSVTLPASHGTAAIHSVFAFTTEPGSPPAGVPVIWYSTTAPWQGSSQPGTYRLVAIDWSGKIVGTIYPGQPLHQAPDGSRLTGQDNTVMDGAGHVLGQQPLSYGNIAWADDSRHYCVIGDSGSSSPALWLETGIAGQTPRRVASLGSPVGRGGFSLLACSISNDRALVADQGMNGYARVWVLALSTGRTLYQHDYTQAQAIWVAGSPDGRYFAEVSNTGTAATIVKRSVDGAIVGRLAPSRLIGFSADDTRLITAPPWGAGAGEIKFLDWRSGNVLWRSPLANSDVQVYMLAHPGAADVVVGIGQPSGAGDVDGVWLVHADGSAGKLIEGSVYLAGYPN